jgi:DNA-binding MarR family transcriptional regulator
MSPVAKEAWRYLADLWFSDEIHDRLHLACEAAGVTPPQLKALLWLESGEPKPMRSIAESLKCDASWVTGIVDGLETRGYAQREAHPVDRRIKVVVITSLGKKAKARALECLYEPPASFGALSVPEQRELRDLLAKIMTKARPSAQ